MAAVPYDRTTETEATIALAFVLTTVGLCIHELSRRTRKASLTAFDYLLYFAYVDVITKDTIALWLVVMGACSDEVLRNQTRKEKDTFDRVFFALAGLRAATTVSVKVAVLFLYKQVFTLERRWFRIAWWTCFLYLVPFFMGIDLAFFGIIFTHKKHAQNGDLKLSNSAFGRMAHMTTAWLNTIADMSILILPLPYLMRLRIQPSQKMALGMLLCIGFFATAGTWAHSILLTVSFAKGKDMSPAYANTLLLLSSVIECAVGITCACLATSRPTFAHLWRWCNALLGRKMGRHEFTELRQRGEHPVLPPEHVDASVKEIVHFRSQPYG